MFSKRNSQLILVELHLNYNLHIIFFKKKKKEEKTKKKKGHHLTRKGVWV